MREREREIAKEEEEEVTRVSICRGMSSRCSQNRMLAEQSSFNIETFLKSNFAFLLINSSYV